MWSHGPCCISYNSGLLRACSAHSERPSLVPSTDCHQDRCIWWMRNPAKRSTAALNAYPGIRALDAVRRCLVLLTSLCLGQTCEILVFLSLWRLAWVNLIPFILYTMFTGLEDSSRTDEVSGPGKKVHWLPLLRMREPPSEASPGFKQDSIFGKSRLQFRT